MTNPMLLLHKPEVELKQQELQLNEERNERENTQATMELALKAVQLQVARREAVVQLVLDRKKNAWTAGPVLMKWIGFFLFQNKVSVYF
ncbi:hypothetical protein GN958_ATG15972 [Phytophthora infestans]|uniref:Uncharacterized protein n=1 Tax=Phytophthora infestans TaxID=4787 RepID=A0A8S9U1B2_PHYIN|nr:hypothetical protein GN958_ATG15972 [Phytophthora infestans]